MKYKKIIKIGVTIILVCVIIVLAYFISEKYKEEAAINLYGDTITKYCFEYGIDANLVYAVIKAESNFDQTAVSSKGAIGLMQIMPQTARYISDKLDIQYSQINLLDYQTNLRYGIFYLKYLSGKFGNMTAVLAAYNAGEGNVSLWLQKYSDDGVTLNSVPFKETEKYIQKVGNFYSRYKNKYNY